LTDLADGRVDAVVCVNEDLFAPNAIQDFFAGEELAMALDQQKKQVQRNALEMNDAAAAAELIGFTIQLEILELIDFGAHGGSTPG
jgi:hypothetical protein